MKKITAYFIVLALFAALVRPVIAGTNEADSGYVRRAFETGVVSGDENGDFHAEKPVTRAEFATMLVRFLGLRGRGLNNFSDVGAEDWFAPYIYTAAENGLIFGYEDGSVRPGSLLKCEDTIVVLGRFYKLCDSGAKRIKNVSDYAQPYYAYALSNNLFAGRGAPYTDPQHYITKGEVLELMYRYDLQSVSTIHFLSGYPRLSDKTEFNKISIGMKTNKPCTVYYDIVESGDKNYSIDKKLSDIGFGNVEVNASLLANVNKIYDIYLKPVTANGIEGKMTVIKNVQPHAFTSGDGSAKYPYVIYNGTQLSQMRYYPEKCYVLGQDVELSGLWTPVEDFGGMLDGAGYRITGLEISAVDVENAGLFSVISGGTVKNLSVDAKINAKKNAGAIAGKIADGIVEDCAVTGYIKAKTNNAGGICGINKGIVRNSLSAVYCANASAYAGGIAGQNYGEISECLSAANSVLSDMYAGGIAGINMGGEIIACVSASMDICDTMTHNSGRITANKSGGVTKNNYCYNRTNTTAINTVLDETSQNGMDAEWNELLNADFYTNVMGWESGRWQSSNSGFRLVCPKKAAKPVLEPGETIYTPIEIRSQEDLRAMSGNETKHYILKNDIMLTMPWKSIGGMSGFSGSLDGNDHIVSGLDLRGEGGMFSNIAGGTVRNLTIRGARTVMTSDGGLIAACNYGYIENCAVSDTITLKKSVIAGAVAGENYGQIINCSVKADFSASTDNITLGGIAANSSGRISGCVYKGRMKAEGKNSVLGGICGYDTGGSISECFAEISASSSNTSAYVGGICGMNEETDIYKCASSGSVALDAQDRIYAGGISGLSENSQIYCAFSVADLSVRAANAYLGGVVGFIGENSIVQNTYSAGTLVETGSGEIYTGGICGYAESGFIMQNVSLNPAIVSSVNIGAILGGGDGLLADNFSCDRTLINSERVANGNKNGAIKSLSVLKKAEFYFTPVDQGGALGWASDRYGDAIWRYENQSAAYDFPTLANVENQYLLKTPNYK